jgi:plasmid stability protein
MLARAARHGRSMEEEFAALGGVNLPEIPREPQNFE